MDTLTFLCLPILNIHTLKLYRTGIIRERNKNVMHTQFAWTYRIRVYTVLKKLRVTINLFSLYALI